MPKVHEFPLLPGAVATDTLIPTQRWKATEDPEPYNIPMSAILAFIEAQLMIPDIQGIYDDDADAAANGVAIGELYELSAGNYYGMPAGIIKTRRE